MDSMVYPPRSSQMAQAKEVDNEQVKCTVNIIRQALGNDHGIQDDGKRADNA